MTNFDIIGSLKSYALTNGWGFLSGDNAWQNYEASQLEYTNGQLILGCNFKSKPVIKNGAITEISYSGLIFLGQKFDNDGTPEVIDDEDTDENESETFNDGTASSLDETFIQKYERRLLSLTTLLNNAIITFSCDNDLDISSVEYGMDLNKYDENLDFVGGSITFIQ